MLYYDLDFELPISRTDIRYARRHDFLRCVLVYIKGRPWMTSFDTPSIVRQFITKAWVLTSQNLLPLPHKIATSFKDDPLFHKRLKYVVIMKHVKSNVISQISLKTVIKGKVIQLGLGVKKIMLQLLQQTICQTFLFSIYFADFFLCPMSCHIQ